MNLVLCIHETRECSLDAAHLVRGIRVVTERLHVFQHARQVQRDLFREALILIEVFVVVPQQAFTKGLHIREEFVGVVRVRIVQVRVVALDAHRLEKAERCQHFGVLESHLDERAIEIGAEHERLVGIPLVGRERTGAYENDEQHDAGPLEEFTDHWSTCEIFLDIRLGNPTTVYRAVSARRRSNSGNSQETGAGGGFASRPAGSGGM